MAAGSILEEIIRPEDVIEKSGIQFVDLPSFLEQPLLFARVAQPRKSIIDFFGVVHGLIRKVEEIDGTPEDRKVIFQADEIDKPLEVEAVTFSTRSRMPGQFSQGKIGGTAAHRIVKPIKIDTIDDPDSMQHKLQIYSWIADNEIQFTIWARTNKQANSRALWFERMMLEYDWYLRTSGFNKVFYLGRGADFSIREDKGQKLYGRPMVYQVTTEEQFTVRENVIRNILVPYSVEE